MTDRIRRQVSRREVLRWGTTLALGGVALGGCAVPPARAADRGTDPPHLHGTVAAGFEPVRDAFAANFERHGEVGASCCVYRDGREVVNLWGGVADQQAARPWTADTLIPVFSTTKVATAVCVHLLAERGQLDLDAPVARYWPEFAAEGKAAIPIRWLLSHRAGLPALEQQVGMDSVLAWDPVVEALAGQRPAWEPGTAHGYHARTFGWLAGEVVRRVSGRSPGRFFAEEVAGPLGLDFWIGLPDEHEHRVGRLLPPQAPDLGSIDPQTLPTALQQLLQAHADPTSLTTRTLTWPELDDNSRAVHSAEIPGHNGIANARSLARLAAGLVGALDGHRVLSTQAVRSAAEVQSDGPDRVLFVDTRFGSGLMLDSSFSRFGGPGRFGHTGSGGALVFADPHAGIGFGYAMNKMAAGAVLGPDPRTTALIEALHACL
jgi:CubicO group peptidase (beta-lactamase class C family)